MLHGGGEGDDHIIGGFGFDEAFDDDGAAGGAEQKLGRKVDELFGQRLEHVGGGELVGVEGQ